MATRKTTATKAKQEALAKADATEPKAEPVAETPTPADAVAPDAEQISTDSKPTEIQGETITGDGTGKAQPPMEETPGVFVRTKRRIKSRRRAGFRFNREGTGIALELLSQEQLEQLLEDPALQVTNCNLPLDEATSEPEA